MTTIKSYTDLEQSKKLAEILPLESADMYYVLIDTDSELYSAGLGEYIGILPHYPCWSLAALLEILPNPHLLRGNLGDDKAWWMVSAYPNDCRFDSDWYSNAIDACCEMVIKLKEINLI